MAMYDAIEGPGERKLCARIDISKASQAGDLEIGKPVKILVSGKIKAIRGPEEGMRTKYKDGKEKGEEKYTYPGSIEIELDKFAVEGTSEFEASFGDMIDEG